MEGLTSRKTGSYAAVRAEPYHGRLLCFSLRPIVGLGKLQNESLHKNSWRTLSLGARCVSGHSANPVPGKTRDDRG